MLGIDNMADRPLSPISSQRKGPAKSGETVAEVSSARASVVDSCLLHVIDQLDGNGCALALCALFLALGICCFTIGVFALAMNQFFLGRMLKAALPVARAGLAVPQPYSLASSG